ncbi:hypothetical protein GCM10027597_15970 [Saccharopolyspora tripterygii]
MLCIETVPAPAQSEGLGMPVARRGAGPTAFRPPRRGKGDLLVSHTPESGDPIEFLYQSRDFAQLAASRAASLPAEELRPELAAYGPVITSTLDELYSLLDTLWDASSGAPVSAPEIAQLSYVQHALGVVVVIARA